MRTTEKQLRDGVPSINEMRKDLAEHEAMTLQTSDVIELLLNGFKGLENMPNADIRYEWDAIFKDLFRLLSSSSKLTSCKILVDKYPPIVYGDVC